MELLIGCGNHREKRVILGWRPSAWTSLVTVDIDPACGADVLADVDEALPFRDESFDELHAYEVLEHLGTQGDAAAFFRHFSEFYRVLKPFGVLCATTPRWDNKWAWSDPGHRRVISPGTLGFLDQETYAGVGTTTMTDYRRLWTGNFRCVFLEDVGDSHAWALQKVPRQWRAPDPPAVKET